jgi:flagella basal body P-ring formation protein FlgA
MKSSSTATSKERKPRSFWFDPRFAIGIALVVVSVLGVLGIVATADSSVQVFVARSALVPGDRVDAGDLLATSVRLGDLDAKYLRAADVPSGGLVVTRAVSAGELVPASAVGARAGVRVASVVVAVQGTLPKSVVAGAVIDLWSASRGEDRSYGPPAVLASSVTVVRVIASDGMVSARDGDSVELLVPRNRIARVLQAIANEDALSLVPASLPVKG